MPSVAPRGDGRWQIRAYLGRGPDGRPVQKARTIDAVSRRVAMRKATEWEADLTRTGLATGERMTVTAVCQAWLATRRDLQQRTAEEYGRIIDRYIDSSPLGRKDAGRVTAVDIEDYFDWLTGRGIGHTQQVRIRFVLSPSYKWAVRRGVAHHNPLSIAETPSQRPRQLGEMPDVDDVLSIIAAAGEQRPEYGRLLFLAMGTGLRRGELAALTVSKVAADHLVVDAAIANVRGGTVAKDTKTHQRRVVPLGEPFRVVAAQQVAWRRHLADTAQVALAPDPYLWSARADGGEPLHPMTLTHVMSRAVKQAGVGKRVRLHDLRHFFAQFLESKGTSASTLKELLGHAQLSTTGIYMHSDRAQKQLAVEAFAELAT